MNIIITVMVILTSLASLALGYFIGYTAKGININITKPNQELPVDQDGKPVYNQSLLDLMPQNIRDEIDKLNILGG